MLEGCASGNEVNPILACRVELAAADVRCLEAFRPF